LLGTSVSLVSIGVSQLVVSGESLS